MKIVTFSHEGRTYMGELDGDRVHRMVWQHGLIELIERGITPERTSEHFPVSDVKLHAPLIPGKILGIGRNYADHAAELGNKLPAEPAIFAKLPSSVIATGETIAWEAALSQQVDWEGELAVVIGRRARNVSEPDAYQYIFGYTVANDVTARDLQAGDGQWVRAKGLDTFCPLGPSIIMRKALADPHTLAIRTTVNGQVMQDGTTADMIFKIPRLIAHCSRAFTLEPGDVILTGTPSGVGKGMNPPRFLGSGDVVTVSIEGIGELVNPCQVL